MHGGIFILIQILIIQNVYSKEILKIKNEPNFFENVQHNDNKVNDFMLIEFKEQRSIAEVWTNIKNSALNAWNALKSLANSTKEKIKVWILNVKERAKAITKLFKEHLKTLKAKIDNLIQSLLNNEDIKKCFKGETEIFKEILLDITNRVTNCIKNKINGLGALEDYKMIDNMLNNTKFEQELDALLIECNKNPENTEECLLKVRQDIFKETEALEDEILKNRQVTRSFTDDILDVIISCSTDGMIESSAVITNEALKIIQCITAIPA